MRYASFYEAPYKRERREVFEMKKGKIQMSLWVDESTRKRLQEYIVSGGMSVKLDQSVVIEKMINDFLDRKEKETSVRKDENI